MALDSLKHLQTCPSDFPEQLAEQTTHRVGGTLILALQEPDIALLEPNRTR